MNTQNLRTLFPTVTKQKILNLSYGEGEHYTVLPMIAQKEDTFYLWEPTVGNFSHVGTGI